MCYFWSCSPPLNAKPLSDPWLLNLSFHASCFQDWQDWHSEPGSGCTQSRPENPTDDFKINICFGWNENLLFACSLSWWMLLLRKCSASSCWGSRMSWYERSESVLEIRNLTFITARVYWRYCYFVNWDVVILFDNFWPSFTHVPIIETITSNQMTLRWGVAADAELLSPAMLVLVQNSWNQRWVDSKNEHIPDAQPSMWPKEGWMTCQS